MISVSPSLPKSPTCSSSHPSPPAIHGVFPPLRPQPLVLTATSLINAINSSAAQKNICLNASLHAAAIKSDLIHTNIFVPNALLDAYAKCNEMGLAANLFDQMYHRDIVSWTSLIAGYSRNNSATSAMSVFCDLISDEFAPAPNEFTIASISQACISLEDERTGQAVHGYCIKKRILESFVCNTLIAMYSKLGFLGSAEKLLDGLERRNVVSWSSFVSGCVLHGLYDEAVRKFITMLEDGLLPNFVTMLSIIQACSLMNEPRFFSWVHAWILKMAIGSNDFVASSLVELYSKNGLLDEAITVFVKLWYAKGNGCLHPDVMAAIVRGCTISRSLQFGRIFHGYLIKQWYVPYIFIENSLIDMYGKLEQVDSANQIFRKMEEKDLVSWNTMISCLLKNNNYFQVLELLAELHGSDDDDLVPDVITILSSIQACAELVSLKRGEIIHGYAVKTGFDSDVFVSNALINMYAKSGRIDSSEKVFHGMDLNDLSTWNAMILAYGIHGDGEKALETFHDLTKCSFLHPNAITFVNVITACSHSGLVTEGRECFQIMETDYGVRPDMDHYASMVDLFARSGRFAEAEKFIRAMPMKPGSAIWCSLLGACGIHGDVEMAERAAEILSVLDPDGKAWKVSLSNVYGLAGRWEDAARVRAGMKKNRGRKEAGWSSVDVNGEESSRFMAGDTNHPEAEIIYNVSNALTEQMKDVCILGF